MDFSPVAAWFFWKEIHFAFFLHLSATAGFIQYGMSDFKLSDFVAVLKATH